MDKDKFCEYIKLYEKAMYSLAFSIVRNESDSGEIISEAVYRAYKNLGTLKNENAFKSWILRIVHNTAIEMIRKNAKVIPMDELPEITDDNERIDIATKIALRDAVESLNQPYRTVIVLFYYENLSVSAISQITNTNTVTVRTQLSRARKMLRNILKEDFNK